MRNLPSPRFRPPTEARFSFGANWRSFARIVDDIRVQEARASLSSRLGDISGLRFLDVGCGSGLFSLAATQLGVNSVHSFDLDPESVATALSLKHRFASRTARWTIGCGDMLDDRYVEELGEWDIVYCWGVLHHTGDMRRSWKNVARLVAPGGRMFISVYNDGGVKSARWTAVKRAYNRIPSPLRPLFVLAVMTPSELSAVRAHGAGAYIQGWREYKKRRGMSRWHDLVDWVGGYPYEVARPEEVVAFFRCRGFSLEWSRTKGVGLGCNEFVLRRQ